MEHYGETDLPAERPCAQAPARISRTDEDRRGTARSGPATGERTQAPQRLTALTGNEPAMAAKLERLKKRKEFLRVAAARRSCARPGLVLQMAPRPAPAGDAVRVGFTASRKVGPAVVRNRARRRLRRAAEVVLGQSGRPGADYVLIARSTTGARSFAEILTDLESALRRVHKGKR